MKLNGTKRIGGSKENQFGVAIFFFFKGIFLGFCAFMYRTAEEWTGNRAERGGMTCSKGPQVESNLGPLCEDIASVYGALALPTASRQ